MIKWHVVGVLFGKESVGDGIYLSFGMESEYSYIGHLHLHLVAGPKHDEITMFHGKLGVYSVFQS